MNLYITVFLSFLFLFSDSAVVEWQSEKSYDFGALNQFEPDTAYFTFKNIDDGPMVIDNVRTTCGCTAVEWTEDVIEKDSTTTIAVEYNSYKTGYFRKKIRVFVSSQRKGEDLWIEGEVVPKDPVGQ